MKFSDETVEQWQARMAESVELAKTLTLDEAMDLASTLGQKYLFDLTREERVQFVAANLVIRNEA